MARRPSKFRDATGLVAVSPVADHRVRPGNWNVEHRQSVDRKAEISKIIGYQPSAEPDGNLGLRVRQRSQAGCRRIEAPGGRPQPSHSPSLLVDQDWRVAAPNRAAQRRYQLADLVGRAAVTAEQNKTDRIGSAEEAAFVVAQLFSGTPQNDRAWRLPARCPDFIGQ